MPYAHAASERATKGVEDPGMKEVARLLAEQRAATNTGNTATVEDTTKKLAAAALRQMADVRLLQGEGDDAVALYRQSLLLQDTEDARVEYATALFRTHKADQARVEVKKVLAADAKNARALQLQGSLDMASQDYRTAIESLARSLDLKPDVNAQYALGFSLLKTQQKEKAAVVFKQMLESYGDKAIWHVVFGGAYRDTDYPNDAVVEFKRAIAMDPKVGHAHFFLGLTYLQLNHWGANPQSLKEFEEAIRLEPKSYLVNFYLGALESTAKNFADSDRHLHVAAEVEPRSPEIWLYLGLNAYDEQKLADAKTYLHKAIDTTGADEGRNNYQIRRAYFVLGRIAVSEGSREEASKYLGKVRSFQQKALANSAETISDTMQQEGLATAPAVVAPPEKNAIQDAVPAAAFDDPGATNTADAQAPEVAQREKQLRQILASSFNDLGTAQARQQQFEAALANFREAEKWDASTPGVQRNIGLAAFRQEDFVTSANALQKVVDANPADQRSRMMLGMSLFSLEKYNDAAAAFAPIEAAVTREPRAAYAWAFSLAKTGRQQQANQLADALSGEAMPPDVLSLVCHLYTETENYEHALTCYRKAYSESPELKRAHYEAGAALIRLDRPGDAIPELQEELKLSPEDPEVQYYLAFAFLQTSRRDEAVKLLESVIAAQPNHAQAQYQMGKLLLEDGKTQQAIEHLEIAERNEPGTDYIHYQLQKAYRNSGRSADADRELKIYRDIKASHREVTPEHAARPGGGK